MSELIPLEVGQKVVIEKSQYSWTEYSVDTVDRFTKTQIVLSSGMKFRIDNQRHISKAERFQSVHYYIYELTEKFKEKIFRQNALREIKELKFGELSNDKLRKIIKVVKTEAEEES